MLLGVVRLTPARPVLRLVLRRVDVRVHPAFGHELDDLDARVV
jgi:hypothetical protein